MCVSSNVCIVCFGNVKLLFAFCVFSENLVRYTAFLHFDLFRLNYLENCSILVTEAIMLL